MEGNVNASGETSYSDSIGILYVVRETSTPPASSPVAAASATAGSAAIDGTSNGAGNGRGGGGVYSMGAGGGEVSGGGGGGVEVDGQPSRLVTVKNLRPRRRVVIAVVNVSMYFSVTAVNESSEDDGGGGGGSGGGGVGGDLVGFRGWGQGLGAVGVGGGIELFDVPAGETLTLRVTPRLDKLRSGEGLALLANEQSLEVRRGNSPVLLVLNVVPLVGRKGRDSASLVETYREILLT